MSIELDAATWRTLELRGKGCVKPLRHPKRSCPKIDALIEGAKKNGFQVSLLAPLPDEDADPADQLVVAVVCDGIDSWKSEGFHPGMTLALAFAAALEATAPKQAPLFEQNGHHDRDDDEAIVVPFVEVDALPSGPLALAEVAG
jgi:hypothetical protein